MLLADHIVFGMVIKKKLSIGKMTVMFYETYWYLMEAEFKHIILI